MNWKWIFLGAVVLGGAYGAYSETRLGGHGPIFGLFGGAVVGLVFASVAALVVGIAQRFRLKNPGPVAIWAGRIIFWLGCTFAVVTFLAAVAYPLYEGGGLPPFRFLIMGFGGALCYAALARGIQYMLGR